MLTDWTREPYRILFPLGTILFLCGILLWLPQIWSAESYPVVTHRYLMLNGFLACFIGGFLMTAVPKFSQTKVAQPFEVISFTALTLIGVVLAHLDLEKATFVISGLQPLLLLKFLLSRISQRRVNPPYSFVFIFVGLFLWMISAFYSALIDIETLKRLHYEGAIAAIILGVGSRLIPGILGHVEIVAAQRNIYEQPVAIWMTVPLSFVIAIIFFVISYIMPETAGEWVRALIVSFIAMSYWRLYALPKDRTALTWSIWASSYLIVTSFVLRAAWSEASIHISHSFFINGIALLSFLIATRVLQSHGPQNKSLENKKTLYLVTALIVISAFTRVSAYLLPDSYLPHLGYSSLILSLAVIIWSFTYLKYAKVFPSGVV